MNMQYNEKTTGHIFLQKLQIHFRNLKTAFVERLQSTWNLQNQ